MSRPSQPLRRGSSAEAVARNIRADIEAGRYVHGEQLPSTKELAREWGTSTATVSRAMQMLAADGLVVNRARSSRIVQFQPRAHRTGDTASPVAVLVGGYAGSGKTELGRILARTTGWAILDKDTTTRPVVEAALEKLGLSPHDRESETYRTVVRPAEYTALTAAIMENVECGVSVVATAPFIRELDDQAWCDRLRASVAEAGGQLHVVWVRCDPDSMLHYLRHRGAARDTAKLAAWEDYLAGVDLDFTPAIEHVIIDNSRGARPLSEQAEQFIKAVQAA